ncbi:MAG: hypothetical protein CO093_10975 [Alphaproteobacteria bacterium CG_4_9_14_3_um_filter_47_13]|nr:MAG: hypothetical protein CO093_10975 [Alphaproteobacteria bacterium CG_4_9_14_3_um_filter_47_13]
MNNFARIFGFFLKTYRKETILVLMLVILAGFAEAVGLAAFLPFFQIVLEGKASLDYIPEGGFKDFVFGRGVPVNFASVSVFIAAAIALKALILWTALRYVGVTVAYISADLRRRLMEGLLRARWGFFIHHTLGSSLNAIINETFRSSMAFISTTRFIAALVQVLIYATGAALLSWKIFLGALAIGLLLVFLLSTLVRVARAAGQSQTHLAKKMLDHMADMLQGIKPLRAMALENKFLDLLTIHSRGLEKSQSAQLISGQSMRVFHEPLMVATAIGGLYLVMTFGSLTSSELALMAVIFIRLLNGMNAAQNEYQRLVVQESALWSLLDVIDKTEAAGDDWPGQSVVPQKIQTIALENVSFSHGKSLILNDVNLAFKPDSMTALIGSSGSGKTTILDLLCGFYVPDAGRILINEKGLDTLALKDWRHNIGFVPQEVFLFNDTILENILVGRDFDEKRVWESLEAAGAKNFVESLADGIHAPVGENGRMLSGGQRQRIAIARAIIHKPQILLLDEATSALDKDTEQVLMKTLQNLTKDMIVIFASHNVAVQDYADYVYRIESGKIIEA